MHGQCSCRRPAGAKRVSTFNKAAIFARYMWCRASITYRAWTLHEQHAIPKYHVCNSECHFSTPPLTSGTCNFKPRRMPSLGGRAKWEHASDRCGRRDAAVLVLVVQAARGAEADGRFPLGPCRARVRHVRSAHAAVHADRVPGICAWLPPRRPTVG